MERLIYFDHNSTTSYSPSVRKYLKQGILEDWYNPSSIYFKAQNLYQKIRDCRQFLSEYLNCSSKHLFFTSGATESINTILSLETLKLHQLSGFISSFLEHHATLKRLNYLSKQKKEVSLVHWITSYQGEIDLNQLEKMCFKYPKSLLSFLSANNETGVITNIKTIRQIAKKYHCLIHVDAVQSLGKEPVDLEDWDVDFVSFSGHKIGAMKGIGLLYAKKAFAPLMHGGGQERALRPGTYNYPAIKSFKLAVQDIDLKKQDYVRKLRDYLEDKLLTLSKESLEKNLSSSFEINCKNANRLPNTSNIYCAGVENHVLVLSLAQKGLYISSGSACNEGSTEPSHVITMLNGSADKAYARSCIRVSLSPSNTKQEVDLLEISLKEILDKHISSYPKKFEGILESSNL